MYGSWNWKPWNSRFSWSYDEEKDIITRKGNAKASATQRTKAWQRIAARVRYMSKA
jgi:hypothetical protein